MIRNEIGVQLQVMGYCSASALRSKIDSSATPNVVGWSDIPVQPFCIKTEEDKAVLQAFEDRVIDRLFVANADRAKNEAALGRGVKKGSKKKAGVKKLASASSKTKAATKATAQAKKSPPEGQGSLF